MKTLLQIHTSLNGAESLSASIASRYVDEWRQRHADGRVVSRDLARNAVPHLTAARFAAFNTAPADRSTDQQAEVALSDELIDELCAADEIVLSVPMYNFGIPSSLKAYIDHVARAGVTFRYTPEGPVGLLAGKRLRIVATRGGAYAGTESDVQSSYLKLVFGFLGIQDVEFIYVEGLAMGDDARKAALDDAFIRIPELLSLAA